MPLGPGMWRRSQTDGSFNVLRCGPHIWVEHFWQPYVGTRYEAELPDNP